MTEISWPAARLLAAGRRTVPVPGSLELSDTHLRFRPTGIATRLEAAPFSVQRKHIAAVGVVEGSGGLLRRPRLRLCVTLGDGSEQLFDAADAQALAEAVRDGLGLQ